jgi:hypothetical protein
MNKQPTEAGYLLIDGETIGVLYAKGKWGTSLRLRPVMAGKVLGEWLKDESDEIKASKPGVMRRLRSGEVIHL